MNRTALVKRALIIGLVALSFCYGIAVGRKEYPPYGAIRWIYAGLFETKNEREFAKPKYNQINPEFYKNDLNALITITSEADVDNLRKQLENYIWPGQGLPQTKMPSEISYDIQDEKCRDLAGLKSINRIVIRMDYGLDSIVYHFIPEKKNNKLVIYHAGHSEDFRDARAVISTLLKHGYSVFGMSMPVTGMNSRPYFDSDHNGRFLLADHNQFQYLKDPIRFFLEPVVIALNYASKAVGYESIYMIGFSGGGWTTTMCAALDPRILKSYPVAGTGPFFLYDGFAWGDHEQTDPGLYRIANHLELYVLGSYGEGRKQVQVLNQFDTCCFYGLKYQVYEEKVKSVMATLKRGSFEIISDSSQRGHKLSEYALEKIVYDLER